MTATDDFFQLHRVVPHDVHSEEGDYGHDPRIRDLHRAFKVWCAKNDRHPDNEPEFTAKAVAAGHGRYIESDGTHLRDLLLPTAVEHAGSDDPEAHWIEVERSMRADWEANKERVARMNEDMVKEQAAIDRVRDVDRWWSAGIAYTYLIFGNALPDHIEAARAERFRRADFNREVGSEFARLTAKLRGWVGDGASSLPNVVQRASDAKEWLAKVDLATSTEAKVEFLRGWDALTAVV